MLTTIIAVHATVMPWGKLEPTATSQQAGLLASSHSPGRNSGEQYRNLNS